MKVRGDVSSVNLSTGEKHEWLVGDGEVRQVHVSARLAHSEGKMAENILDGLFRQMNRCRELVKDYESIGPAGAFGRAMILQDIAAAEKAIAGGDVVEIIAAYKVLEGCE